MINHYKKCFTFSLTGGWGGKTHGQKYKGADGNVDYDMLVMFYNAHCTHTSAHGIAYRHT